MPGGDKTGPTGMGPMTGRGAGYCSGAGIPGYSNAGFGGGFGRARGGGFGFGRGMGGGRGRRYGFYATGLPGWARGGRDRLAMSPGPVELGNELTILQEQARHLEAALKDINKQLEELRLQKGS